MTSLCVGAKLSGVIVFPSLLLCLGFKLFSEPSNKSLTQKFSPLAVIGCSAAVAAAFLSLLYLQADGPLRYANSVGLIYSNLPDGYLSYLLGERKPNFWNYNFVAFGLKTPLPAILVFLVGAIRMWVIFPAKVRWVTIPPLVGFAISMFDATNIGIRRILLVYPFMFVIGGAFFSNLGVLRPNASLKLVTRSNLLKVAAAAAIFLYLVISDAGQYPNYLTYFNRIVPQNAGLRYLGESNISWGQSLPALRTYLRENELSTVVLHYYGHDTPADYGIDSTDFAHPDILHPAQSVYAISAHYLVLMKTAGPASGDWLDRFEPDAVVGGSIFIFDFRSGFPNSDRTAAESLSIANKLFERGDWESAIVHFQSYLMKFPRDISAHEKLMIIAEKTNHENLLEFHKQQAGKLRRLDSQ